MTAADLADVMTIVSGAVLASAALVAFIVQRARYLRETTVVLAVDQIDPPTLGHVGVIDGELQLVPDLDMKLTNPTTSQIILKDPQGSVDFVLHGDRDRRIRHPVIDFERDGLGGDTYIGPNESARFHVPFEYHEFHETAHSFDCYYEFSLVYELKTDLLMILLRPFSVGRRRFRRTVSGFFHIIYEPMDATGNYKVVVNNFTWGIRRRNELGFEVSKVRSVLNSCLSSIRSIGAREQV